MMRVTAWLRRIFSNRGRPVTTSTPKPSLSETSVDSLDYPESDVPLDITPTCHWMEGQFDYRSLFKEDGGYILVSILGMPGVGVRSLINRVKEGIIAGKVSYDPTLEDTPPSFCCEGVAYDVGLESQAQTIDQPFEITHSYQFFGIILAYDVESRASWEQLCRCEQVLHRTPARHRNRPPILILAMKVDLASKDGLVLQEEAEKFAHLRGYRHMGCSALTGIGALEVLEYFVELAYVEKCRFQAQHAKRLLRLKQSRDAFTRTLLALRLPEPGSNEGDQGNGKQELRHDSNTVASKGSSTVTTQVSLVKEFAEFVDSSFDASTRRDLT